jgi:hypothetical protein
MGEFAHKPPVGVSRPEPAQAWSLDDRASSHEAHEATAQGSRRGIAPNAALAVRALVQFRQALNRGPGVTRVAQLTAALHPVQRLNAQGGAMVSVDQNREVFVQSDVAANFRYALPAPMTYHHVIPRNKLATFWNAVQANGELAHLSPAIDSLISRAIARIHDTPDLAAHSAVLDVQGVEQDHSQLMAVMKRMGASQQLTAVEAEGANVIEKIYQWWPANIHHGPTARTHDLDPEQDDGGDSFEIAARHVLPADQYNKLKKLDEAMDSYQRESAKPRVKTLKTIKGLIVQLSSVTNVQAYDAARWRQESRGTNQGLWRIVPRS